MCSGLLKLIAKIKIIVYFYQNKIFCESKSININSIKKISHLNLKNILDVMQNMQEEKLLIYKNNHYYMDEYIFQYRYVYRYKQILSYIVLILLGVSYCLFNWGV